MRKVGCTVIAKAVRWLSEKKSKLVFGLLVAIIVASVTISIPLSYFTLRSGYTRGSFGHGISANFMSVDIDSIDTASNSMTVYVNVAISSDYLSNATEHAVKGLTKITILLTTTS